MLLDRDRVSFQRDQVTLWSTEKVKFRQWQHLYHLSDVVAANLGHVQHDHAALGRGALMPALPYIMDLLLHLGLNTVVSPSGFEMQQYTQWCSISENFDWG